MIRIKLVDEEIVVKIITGKIKNICKSGVSCYLGNQIKTPSQIMQKLSFFTYFILQYLFQKISGNKHEVN